MYNYFTTKFTRETSNKGYMSTSCLQFRAMKAGNSNALKNVNVHLLMSLQLGMKATLLHHQLFVLVISATISVEIKFQVQKPCILGRRT